MGKERPESTLGKLLRAGAQLADDIQEVQEFLKVYGEEGEKAKKKEEDE